MHQVAGKAPVADGLRGKRETADANAAPVGIAREEVHEAEPAETLGRPLRCASFATDERARGDLDERAGLGGCPEARRLLLHVGISLRMAQHGRDPGPTKIVDRPLERERPAEVRELDEQVATGPAEREARELLGIELCELLEGDLAAPQHAQRDVRPGQRTLQLVDAALHLIGGRRIVVAHVRRRRNRGNALGNGGPRDRERVVERLRPVVQTRENVRVEVDDPLRIGGPAGPREEATTSVPVEGIARNTVFALAVHLTSAVFTAALTLFLARALSPDGYGLFALAFGIAALATLPSDFGISASAARFIAEHRGDRSAVAAVLADALKLKLLIAGAVSVALVALAGPIASAYGAPDLRWPLRGIALAVFGQSLMLLFGGAFVAQGRTSRNLKLVLGESAVEFSASVALVLLGGGAAGAAFGRAVGYTFGAVLGLLMLTRMLRGTRGNATAAHAGSMRRIAGYAGALALVDWVYTSLSYVDILIIGALLDSAAVGIFHAPLRLIAVPLYVGLAVASGVAPRLARHATERPSVQAFVVAVRLLIVFQAAVTVVLLVWAEPLVELLLGSDYRESADVLRALAPFVFLAGLAPLVSLAANYLGAARSRVPIAVAALIVNAGLDLVLIPEYGVVGAAVATSAGFAIYVPAHFWVCRRFVDLPLRPIFATLARSGLAGVALAGALLAAGTSELSASEWVLGAVGGSLAFAALLVATRELTAADVRSAWALAGGGRSRR